MRVSTFSGVGQNRPRQLAVIGIPRTCQYFPDLYSAHCTTNTEIGFTANNLHQTFAITAPLNLFGPRVNFASTFSANVPSGSRYLLSGLSDSGASAPYNSYLVTDYEMEVSIASSATTNTMPFIGGITFTTNLTATQGMSVTQLPELPHTVSRNIPALTTSKPITFSNSVRLCDMVGLTPEEYRLQRVNYQGSVATPPAFPIYAQQWFVSFDGATTATYNVMIRHRFRIEFYGLNSFIASTPSFLTPNLPISRLVAPVSDNKEARPGWF
jgi:hypothetical protein